jgi:hypothetical protein
MGIENLKNDVNIGLRIKHQKVYADQVYNWNARKDQWNALLNSMLTLPREFEKPKFVYNTGY